MKIFDKLLNWLNRPTIEELHHNYKFLRELDDHMLKYFVSLDKKLYSYFDGTGKFNERNTLSNMVDVPISYDSCELLSIQNEYLHEMNRIEKAKLNDTIMSIEDCIQAYDKLLYKTVNLVSNDYTRLVLHITKLQLMRDAILSYFLGDSDVSSFYLYFTDNKYFRMTLQSLPLIDSEKLFITKSTNDSTINELHYILVNMDDSDIAISSTCNEVHMDTKYRKTVMRVLYSVYMNKFYLYHL